MLRQILRLPLRLIPAERPRRILSGPLGGARWIPASSTHGCWLGVYERRAQRVFASRVRPGDAVLDVGANVGFYSLLASRLVGDGGRVFAFEPLPRNLFYLRRHLDLNGAGNVAVHAVAVAEATGSEFLDVQGDPSMASFSERGLAVPTVSLDQFFDAASAPPPSFVKIDVEGAESRVLRGAKRILRVNHPTVLLSAHGWKQYAECRAILESEKYAMKLVRDGARDGNYLLLAD